MGKKKYHNDIEIIKNYDMRIEIKEKELLGSIINKKFELKINSSKIGSICTDSRLLKKMIFIFRFFKGETYDGHKRVYYKGS